MSTITYEQEVCERKEKRLVRWNVNFIKRGLEHAFPALESIIDEDVSKEEFVNCVIAEFAKNLDQFPRPELWERKNYPPPGPDGKRRLPPGDGKYLRVTARVLETTLGPEFDFEEEQIAALEEIRDAIAHESPFPDGVRLPKTGVLAGAMLTLNDEKKSEFGDEFVNFPPEFGERPKPGETQLSGWIRVQFDEPKGNTVNFNFTYHGVGTPVRIQWGGGQYYDFLRTQTFPTPPIPGLPLEPKNSGRLNLKTGKVDEVSIFATFQGTTIARTDKVNRIPYAFPYMYPLPPLDKIGLTPEILKKYNIPPPQIDPSLVFADFKFHYDDDGNITGLALESESVAPTGLFPFTPPIPNGLFPAFSWGRDFGFHFANPDGCLPGTEYCPTDATNPDGVLRPPSSYKVFFHPHINLYTESLAEVTPVRPTPACLPEDLTDAVAVAANGRLYVCGGHAAASTASDQVWVYDPAQNAWSEGPKMSQAVSNAQGAAVGGKVYVIGGRMGNNRVSGAVQILDTASGTWSKGSNDLPTSVREGTATAVGKKIYVISGATNAAKIPSLSDSVQILDTASGTWTTGAAVPTPVVGAAAVDVDGKIWVISGRPDGAEEAGRQTNLYDTAGDRWITGEDTEHGVYRGVAGRLGDRLILAGGRGSVDGPTSVEVQELRLENDAKWHRALPMVMPTASSGGAVSGDTLFVVGGTVSVGAQEVAGYPIVVMQTYMNHRGWRACDDRPLFTSAGLVNAAGLRFAPPELAPGSYVLLLGENMGEPDEPRRITVVKGDQHWDYDPTSLTVFFRTGVLFRLPDFAVSEEDEVFELEYQLEGKPAVPAVPFKAREASAGLFIYTFGETEEKTFLDPAPGVAMNDSDHTLNFANQPVAPGQTVALYTTGLGKDPKAGDVEAWLGPDRSTVAKVTKLEEGPYDGVYRVFIEVPDGFKDFSNNVEAVIRHKAQSAGSNTVMISIQAEATRPTPTIPPEYAIPFAFEPQVPPPKPPTC